MNDTLRSGWKALTHDLRPPVQGGEPIFDGSLPHVLGEVALDTSPGDCKAGWNYCSDIETALRIAGFWRDGRPRRLFAVEASEDAIQRAEKRRCSQLTLLREATAEEMQAALLRFSAAFAPHSEEMAREQWLWLEALGRPCSVPEEVERHLQTALHARGLGWSLKRFPAARAAWDARATWDAWNTWADRDAWAARYAWNTWAARYARAAWAAWDAWDAWDALTVHFAARQGWTNDAPGHLTDGLREAYRAGLGIAHPTGPDELGWAMDREDETA